MCTEGHLPESRPAPRSVRDLLAGIIDYAGLFPPAGLDVHSAAESYAAYRTGPNAWALGRFVVPAARLEELAGALTPLAALARDPWRLAVLVGPDRAGDVERIRAFSELPVVRRGVAVADVVEVRVATNDDIVGPLRERFAGFTSFVEIPVDINLRERTAGLARAGARAKIRTGGVTPDSFPTPDALLGFLSACVEADLPFKATAGLHHPVAGLYPLTCEPGSRTVPMYGYLNLLFATALLRRRAPELHVAAALAETDATAFRFDDRFATWREYALGRSEIGALRQQGMISFGSCSFREPLDELVISGDDGGRRPSR